MRTILFLLVFTLLFHSARAGDDAYFPLAVGLRWESSMELTTPAGDVLHGTALREITGIQEIAGKSYYINKVRFTGFPGLPDEMVIYRRKAADGVYAIKDSDPQKTEFLEVALPLVVGKTWTATISGKKVEFKVEAQETVTVGDRSFDKCFKIAYQAEAPIPSGHFFQAPAIGNVLETFTQGGATLRFTFKSFNGSK